MDAATSQNDQDERGAGGKAARSRRANQGSKPDTPGRGFLHMLRSPIQAAVNTVRTALVSPRQPGGPAQEASGELPLGELQPDSAQPETDWQDVAGMQMQATPVTSAAAVTAGTSAPQTAALALPAKPAALYGDCADACNQKAGEGWSPSKVDSLRFFLGARSSTTSTAVPPPQKENIMVTADSSRPYLGLNYLLKHGKMGVELPTTLMSRSMSTTTYHANGVSTWKSSMGARAQNTSRFAPYPSARPSQATQPRFTGLALPEPAVPSMTPVAAPRPATPYNRAMPSPHVTFAPSLMGTPATEGRPSSSAGHGNAMPASSLRLALANAALRGQDRAAASNGVAQTLRFTSTPGPKSASKPVVDAEPASTSTKRGRDNTIGTPVGSGIKNLAEYKRQRQRYTIQVKPMLPVSAAQSRETTPDVSGSESAAPQLQLPASTPAADTSRAADAVTPLSGGMATTATARRILETLDNMAKASDNQQSSAKDGSRSAKPSPMSSPMPGPGRPGATPFFRGMAPPLDRLTPMATPETSRVVYGLMPSNSPAPASSRGSGAAIPAVLFPSSEPNTVEKAPAADAPSPAPKPSGTAPASAGVAVSFSAAQGTSTAPPEPQPAAAAQQPAPALSQPAAPRVHFQLPNATPPKPKQTDTVAPAVGTHTAPSSFKRSAEAGSAGSAVPAFEFGTKPQSDDIKAVNAIASSAASRHGIPVPKFLFGQFGTKVVPPITSPPKPPSPSPADAVAVQAQVAHAANVPLPDDEPEEEPAPMASAPAVASGWGADFLAQNQAQSSAAAEAVAKAVEDAKAPAASSAPAQAFKFGVTQAAPSTTASAQPSSSGQDAAAAHPAAASSSAAGTTTSAPAGGGWDLSFLEKSKAAMDSASAAAEKEISNSKAPAAAASSFLFGAQTTQGKEDAPHAPASSQPTTGGFAFGMTSGTPAMSGTASGPSAGFSFGTGGSSTPAFGTTPDAASAPATSTGSLPFAFGAAPQAAASAPPASTPASTGFMFGASAASPAASTSAPASTPPFTFGAASAAANTTPTFGSQPSTTPAGFMFGAPAAAQAQSAPAAASTLTTSFVFGSQPGAASTPATASFTFGSGQPAAAAAASSPAPSFGSAMPASAAQPAENLFGQAQGFGGFGSAPSSSPAPQTSAFGFGGSTTPAASPGFPFGAPHSQLQPQAMPQQQPFGSPMPFGGVSTSNFGTPTTQPHFGAAQSTTPTFGATPPFGAHASDPGLASPGSTPFVFGAPNAAPGASVAFGSPAPQFQAAAPAPFAPAPLPAPAPAGGFGAGFPNAFNAGSTPGMGAVPGGMGGAAGDMGGFTMGSLGDQGGAKGDRRKLRARRHG